MAWAPSSRASVVDTGSSTTIGALQQRRTGTPEAKPAVQMNRRGKFAGAKPGKRLRGRR